MAHSFATHLMFRDQAEQDRFGVSWQLNLP